ncbi:hypothetical protein Lal_00021964 [Lupinus albus]|nr:hypothetical protein Lal_00021964 [Lupinus albus]
MLTAQFSSMREKFAQARLYSFESQHTVVLTVVSNVKIKKVVDKNHPPSKKHKSGTSGQVAPSFNRNKFTSLEREEWYTTLLQWAFIPERRVELQHNECTDFLE